MSNLLSGNVDEILSILGWETPKKSPKKKKNKNSYERYQQKDENGYVCYLDGFWSKGRANELIDNKGVGHYYQGNSVHGCNGSCSREDFAMAADLDKINVNIVKYMQEYGITDGITEEVKIEYKVY